MIKTFLSALLLASVATPSLELTAEDRRHNRLIETLGEAGVSVYINHPEACDGQVLGWYNGVGKMIAICQENVVKYNSSQVQFSNEDYDTLRHEAHHFVQDCMIGTNHDSELKPVYEDPFQLAKTVLGFGSMQKIYNGYKDLGKHAVILEFEAFSVAALNDIDEQIADIEKYCM